MTESKIMIIDFICIFLLWFAHHDLYTPKWSKHIFDEWVEAMIRKGIPEDEALKRTSIVSDAFPDALVEHYEPLIEDLITS